MCGICGILDKKHRLISIGFMNQAQQHRGPDDEGYLFLDTSTNQWCAAGGGDTPDDLSLISYQQVDVNDYDLVLGSRRLAILDLSPAGHMPMSYHSDQFWLVFNGEIYNYRELRDELKAVGHHFSNDTDTEVILAAYAEWGVECLSHFNGMFAFALWDARQRRLFCARDRFGIKPFYYCQPDGAFIFASEIKSLLQHPIVPRVPNDQAIYDYLARGLSDHTEETFFVGIRALPAAHFILYETESDQLTTHRWWRAKINPSVSEGSGNGRQDAYHEFTHLLEDAIRLRLRSDVPVGSCLSGGLDSSSIVTLANRLLLEEQVIPPHLVGEHQKTFTARNREAPIDEYQYSHRIVQQTGAEENLVFPDGETLWNEYERFVWHMDEPVDSTSQYPQWNVMRLAKERGVTVLLDGQGGDEILAGYYAYYPAYLSQLLQQRGLLQAGQAAWDLARVGGSPAIDTLYSSGLQRLPWRAQQLVRRVRPPRSTPGTGGSGLTEWQLSTTFQQRFWERRWQPETAVDANGLVGILYRDLTATNLPKLLRYEDRNSMAFSLETRLPFLDYRLVEKVFSLPLNYRIHKGWSKWILRQAMNDILPPEICWRRSKLGFPTPEENWLRQGSDTIRRLLQDSENNEALHAYIEPGIMTRIAAQPDNQLAATPGLWRLVNLIVWYDIFFERRIRATDNLAHHNARA